ncbi:MAG: DUF2075 domain-containing protein [Verrucomicrobiae bacterium]|nr:DUF2075 domain-containing protein [Verrucomicrobiae bacterium]
MPNNSPAHNLSRAWYGASIAEFMAAGNDVVLGQLTQNCDCDIPQPQKNAWLCQIDILRSQIEGLRGAVFFEFNIPRMGRRADVILLVGPVVFVLEFKVGAQKADSSAVSQVWDYALDLKNFHKASHPLCIVPVLIITEAKHTPSLRWLEDADGVVRPLITNGFRLREVINFALENRHGTEIDGHAWMNAPYRPTPTIIEAARCLYAQHSVGAIAHFDAEAQNLGVTSKRIEELVDEAQKYRRKYICFVTGVPGAGKTLVGLNVATHRRDGGNAAHAVYLSGNGPLVAVLREALTRDELERVRLRGENVRKGRIGESVKAFIQNVHHFRDEGLADDRPPPEHVVIFDEAQRAWNWKHTANFMRRKKRINSFRQSEPEFLISYMDRHQDWAFVVCLVGGGQEIHTGEAGIAAWLDAVQQHFPHWHMFISSRLTDSEYAAGRALEKVRTHRHYYLDDKLHLAVSMRSFRTERVSHFVKALLDGERDQARKLYEEFANRYPVVLSRDLEAAKAWIRSRARGSERYGLMASSKAMRLKPYAIDIRVSVDPVHYFLNGPEDIRSSLYLEDAATEFQVQGLELDWVCVNWDADFRFEEGAWKHHDFRGSRWTRIVNPDHQAYLKNAYRVLLTRARQGMVIFIPPGNGADATRVPAYYDGTYNYLRELGIPVIPA